MESSLKNYYKKGEKAKFTVFDFLNIIDNDLLLFNTYRSTQQVYSAHQKNLRCRTVEN